MTLDEHGQNEIHKNLSNTIASSRSMEIHHWDLISQICVGSYSCQETLRRVKTYPRLALLCSSIVCWLMMFAWETSPTLKNALSYLFIHTAVSRLGGKCMPFMTTQLPILQQSWTSWNVDVQGISETKLHHLSAYKFMNNNCIKFSFSA